jgi:hypothetical protein
LTCQECRHRNTKAKRRPNQVIKTEIAKQKERSRPVKEDLERYLQLWQEQSGEHVLLRHSKTRLLTVDDYLENIP